MEGKICLTGASGFLGWAFVHEQPAQDFFLPLRKRSEYLSLATVISDWKEEKWYEVLKREEVSAVVNTAALSDPGACERNPELSRWVNLEWPLLMGRLCKDLKIPFVHFSTDLVFDGIAGYYEDGAVQSPISLYGSHKAKVELELPLLNPDAWICRLPLLFGECGHGLKKGWTNWLENARKGIQQPLFIDEYRTPIRTNRVSKFVLSRIGELKGVMNLGGMEALSRYEMGEAVCEVFGLGAACIKPTKLSELNLVPPRPARLVLGSDLAYKEGLESKPFREELLEIRDGGGWFRE